MNQKRLSSHRLRAKIHNVRLAAFNAETPELRKLRDKIVSDAKRELQRRGDA